MRTRTLSLLTPPAPPSAPPGSEGGGEPILPPASAQVPTSAPNHTGLLWADWHVEAPSDCGWSLGVCPACARLDRTAATLVVSDGGVFYCARCGKHGDARVPPGRYRGATPVEALLHTPTPERTDLNAVLTGLGLQAAAVREVLGDLVLAHGWFDDEVSGGGWHPCLMLPVRAAADGPVVDVVQLRFDPQTGALVSHQRARLGSAVPWGWDRASGERLVVVDHPLDALALVGAGEPDVVALPECMNPVRAGGGDWSALSIPDVERRVADAKDVVLAFRPTPSNARFEDELARRLGRERCRRTRWLPFSTDRPQTGAAAVVAAAGPEQARACLESATPFPVAGVHELLDVDEHFELLYEFGLQPGLGTGWPSLDVHYTVKPGQWTVITGIPGHGKSTFLDALLVNLAQHHDWSFGLFSPENQPIERHFASLMEKALGAPFNKGHGGRARITPDQKNVTKAWLNEHFKILLPDEEQGNWTLDGVLDLARVLVYRHGIRGLVIDPWNELDHARPHNLTETEHISHCLTKIRRFARLYGVHVWVVAHPTKLEPKADGRYPVPTPYMISGGAHWRNKADNALAVYRNVGEDDNDVSDIHIQKIRFKEIGRVGLVSLRSDSACGRYHDDLDQEKRALALKDGRFLRSGLLRTTERLPAYGASAGNGLYYQEEDSDPLRSAYDPA